MDKKVWKFILEENNNEFIFQKSKSNLEIRFNRIAFIFFFFFYYFYNIFNSSNSFRIKKNRYSKLVNNLTQLILTDALTLLIEMEIF